MPTLVLNTKRNRQVVGATAVQFLHIVICLFAELRIRYRQIIGIAAVSEAYPQTLPIGAEAILHEEVHVLRFDEHQRVSKCLVAIRMNGFPPVAKEQRVPMVAEQIENFFSCSKMVDFLDTTEVVILTLGTIWTRLNIGEFYDVHDVTGRGEMHWNLTVFRIPGHRTYPFWGSVFHHQGVGVVLVLGELNPTDATSAILVGDCHANK